MGRKHVERGKQRTLAVRLWIALLLFASPFSYGACQQDDPLLFFDIPPLKAADALNRFSEQANVNLIFPYKEANQRRANAVLGRYCLSAALAVLLEDSGLVGSFSETGTVKISVLKENNDTKGKSTVNQNKTGSRGREGFFAAFVGGLLSVTAPLPATADGESPAINEVIVSAQKREQNLQEVPISETVLGEDILANARIDSGTEIARQTPNLRASLLGNESQPKFSLRGVSTATFNLNGISSVGVFYDEVYVGATYQGGAQIFDIERVEVLRGPQGTLFGKNTTGGAINFISKKPTFEQEGYLSVGAGSNGFTEYSGAAELPLVDDRLSARIAFTGEHSDGYIENKNPAGRDLSSIDRQAVRLTLGYQDDNGLEATLRIFTNEENADAIGAIAQGTFPGNINAGFVNPRVNPFTGGSLDTDEVATDRSGVIEVRGKGTNLTVVKDFGDVSLTSITSYLDASFLNLVDGDGSIAPVLHIDFGAEDEEFSQDLRLTSDYEGAFNWILGLYYYKSNLSVDTTYRVFELFPTGGTANQSYDQIRESYAVYGDFTFDLNEIYTLYGGLRFTDDEGTMEDFQVITSGTAFGPGIPLQSDITYDDSEPTGRIGLKAQLTDDMMVYGQFVYGYRSSDINGGALTAASDLTIAEPETLKSYEVGIKSLWLDNRIMFNASLFHYDFKDQQFIDVRAITDQKLVNAGSSSITGLEIETLFVLTENLRVTLGLGLLDSEYDDLELGNPAVDFSGNELIEAPEYSFNFAIDYSLPLDDAGTLDFHVDGIRVDEQYFSHTNADSFKVDSYFDMGARIVYRPVSEQFEIALYGKNLTDNDEPGGLQQAPDFGVSFATVPYPRRYGVEFTVRF